MSISWYVFAAHSKMQRRVTDLVLESFGTQSYKKAMDCLQVLREESIKVCDVKDYLNVHGSFLGKLLQVTVHRMLRDRCPVLSACNIGVLWPNGWMDQDETWHGGRPQP